MEVFEIWAIFVGHSFIAFGAVFIFFPFGISLFLVFGHFGLTVAITLILVLTKNTNFLVKMLSGIILVGNIGMFKLAIFGIVRSNGGYFSEFYLWEWYKYLFVLFGVFQFYWEVCNNFKFSYFHKKTIFCILFYQNPFWYVTNTLIHFYLSFKNKSFSNITH